MEALGMIDLMSYILGKNSGGSGGGLTKIAEKSYNVTTTSAVKEYIETWDTGHPEIWTSDSILYIRVRDEAGKRNGYFYGSDTFFYNEYPYNNNTLYRFSNGLRYIRSINENGTMKSNFYTGTSGNGIWADNFSNDGKISIVDQYSSNNSRAIDGTYKVEVFLIDAPIV